MRLPGKARIQVTLAISSLCAAMTVSAQSKEGSSPKQTDPPSDAPKTVVGCLTGYDGHYTLGTSSDTLYLLEGDSALFKRYNARMVQATGTVSEPPPGPSKNNVLSQQPPKLTVSKLKKVADGCN
jgi:hypothetical protein